MICWRLPVPVFSSRFVKSPAAPFTATAVTSALVPIRSVIVDTGRAEAFFASIFALTERFRSVSLCGTVTDRSYFDTCQVAETRVSSWAKTTKLQTKSKRKPDKTALRFCGLNILICEIVDKFKFGK